MFTRAFVLQRKCTYAWGGGGQAVIFFWGGTRSKKHVSGTGPVTLVWGTIFARGAHFSLRRHKQRLWEYGPEMPPSGNWRGLGLDNKKWVGSD